jgi:hypothetical protein
MGKVKILHDHAVFTLGLLDTTIYSFGVSLSLGGHLALGSPHRHLCATTNKIVHVNKFSNFLIYQLGTILKMFFNGLPTMKSTVGNIVKNLMPVPN